MAASLQLYGVKAPGLAISSKRLEFSTKGINFSVNQATSSAVFRTVEHSCRNIALRVTCEAGRVDLLERRELETSNFSGTGKELTCVMKFGGSSVASAERMKEIANLILSFPDERPVVVLSAMGKTTNKLLMVTQQSCSFLLISYDVRYYSVNYFLGILAFIRLERRLLLAVSLT